MYVTNKEKHCLTLRSNKLHILDLTSTVLCWYIYTSRKPNFRSFRKFFKEKSDDMPFFRCITVRQQEVRVVCLSTAVSFTISVKPHSWGLRWSHSIVLQPFSPSSMLKQANKWETTLIFVLGYYITPENNMRYSYSSLNAKFQASCQSVLNCTPTSAYFTLQSNALNTKDKKNQSWNVNNLLLFPTYIQLDKLTFRETQHKNRLR